MDLAIYIASFSLLGILVLYLILFTITQLRTWAGSSRLVRFEQDYLKARIDQILDERKFEREKNELSWQGFRKFEVIKKVQETEDVMSFYLTPHDRKPVPPYLPGQYLTFSLDVPDAFRFADGKRSNLKPIIRCYSLSDSPNHSDYYRVTIKKIPAPKDCPNVMPGVVSSYFHDGVKVGDILKVKAPAGHFTLSMSRRTPVVFIGGGVGITPVLSMLNTIVESGSKRETWFFFCVRNGREHMLKEHLAEIARENENIHMQVCYSRPEEQDKEGLDYDYGQRVSLDLFKRVLPSSNFEYYLCGPPLMIHQIRDDLKEWGVPKEKVFFEMFGAASVKKVVPSEKAINQPQAETAGCKVNFAKTGKACVWKQDSGSLLDLAEMNGVAIEFGCRAGNCGTCLTAIKDGKVKHLIDSGATLEEGSCLACIAVPEGDVVIDA